MRTAPIYEIPAELIVSLEHPCIVRNLDNGLKSLGGEAHIVDVSVESRLFLFVSLSHSWSQVLEHRVGDSLLKLDGKTKVLSEPVVGLSLRPHDPLSKKLISTGIDTRDVLVRVTVPKRTGRKRKRGSDEPFVLPTERPKRNDSITVPTLLSRLRDHPSAYLMEPVSHIPEVHRFRNPPDFQLRDSELPIMQQIRSHLVRPSYDRLKGFHLDTAPGDNGLTGFPSAPDLASYDKFYHYDYAQASGICNFLTQDGRIVSQQKFPTARKAVVPIALDAPAPSGPPPDLVLKDFGNAVPNAIEKFKALLERRPVVSRRLLLNVFPEITETIQKEAIQWIGYSFDAGPFAHLIIRYGLDPRTDPKYRIYQSLTFKVEEKWLAVDAASRAIRRSRREPSEDHVFDGHRLDATGRTWQVCDVTDPLLHDILTHAPFNAQCNIHQWGYFQSKTLCVVRGIMRDKMKMMFLKQPAPEYDYRKVIELTDLVRVEGSGKLSAEEAAEQGLNEHILALRADINAQNRKDSSSWQQSQSGGRDLEGDDDAESERASIGADASTPTRDVVERGTRQGRARRSTGRARGSSGRGRAGGRGRGRGGASTANPSSPADDDDNWHHSMQPVVDSGFEVNRSAPPQRVQRQRLLAPRPAPLSREGEIVATSGERTGSAPLTEQQIIDPNLK